jgi:hypothetical protein
MKQVPDEEDVCGRTRLAHTAYALVLVEQIGPPMRMEEDGMDHVGGKWPSSKECDSLSSSEGDGEELDVKCI